MHRLWNRLKILCINLSTYTVPFGAHHIHTISRGRRCCSSRCSRGCDAESAGQLMCLDGRVWMPIRLEPPTSALGRGTCLLSWSIFEMKWMNKINRLKVSMQMHALTSFDWKNLYSLAEYSNNATKKMDIVHFFLFTWNMLRWKWGINTLFGANMNIRN